MALIDDAAQIIKFSAKTALWSVGVIVGIRVLVPVIMPYCKPLVKEAVKEAAKGYAALCDKLQRGTSIPPRSQEDSGTGVAKSVMKPGGEKKVPAREVSTKAAPDKAKITPLRPYQQWSKAELYRKAKELDIAGRSTMNKAQLIRAVRAASKQSPASA